MDRSWFGRLHTIFKTNRRLKKKLSCEHGDKAIKSFPQLEKERDRRESRVLLRLPLYHT